MSQENINQPRSIPKPIPRPDRGSRPERGFRAERNFQQDWDSGPEPEPVFGQHIRLLDVNKPEGRVICECWHCTEGVLIQHQREPQQEEVRVTCPHCGKVAIKLQVAKILSVNAIASPWK